MQRDNTSEASTTSLEAFTATDALSVVLQHPAVAADQQNICRMVQVCKAWRSTIKQSSACLTSIKFSRELPSTEEEPVAAAADIAAELGRCAHWLFTYAGTVRSIELNIEGLESDSSTVSTLRNLSHDVFALGLRAAGQTTSSNTALNAAADAAVSGRLALRSFTCCEALASPIIVSALPAATLTCLSMTVPTDVDVDAALSSLSNLRSLALYSSTDCYYPDSYLSSISKLSKLTDLTVDSISNSSDLSLLPQQLSQLDLRIDHIDEQPVNFNFSHLTELQRLRADVWCPIEAACLPQQLHALDIDYGESAMAALDIPSMQQLKELRIAESQDSPEQLLSLNELQQLEKITLQYSSGFCAAAATPAWLQLQQLSALCLECTGTAEQMQSVMETCSQLTKLTEVYLDCILKLGAAAADEQEAGDAEHGLSAVCQSLEPLTNLKQLTLQLSFWVDMQQDDLLHLSSLTGLTYMWLRVDNLGSSTSLIAVLLELTELQSLTLSGLEEINVLPVIGKLKQLTHLELPKLPEEVQQQGLKYLTKLRSLQELEGFDSCSKEVMEQFWADLRS